MTEEGYTFFRDVRDDTLIRRRPAGSWEVLTREGWRHWPDEDPHDLVELSDAEAATLADGRLVEPVAA